MKLNSVNSFSKAKIETQMKITIVNSKYKVRKRKNSTDSREKLVNKTYNLKIPQFMAYWVFPKIEHQSCRGRR